MPGSPIPLLRETAACFFERYAFYLKFQMTLLGSRSGQIVWVIIRWRDDNSANVKEVRPESFARKEMVFTLKSFILGGDSEDESKTIT